MNTEMFWSANGAMTDLAILVTPMGCELEKLPPPDTTFKASQVASATLRCSEEGSSVGGEADDTWKACDCDGSSGPGTGPAACQCPPSGLGSLVCRSRMASEVPAWGDREGRPSEDLRRADHSHGNHSPVRQPVPLAEKGPSWPGLPEGQAASQERGKLRGEEREERRLRGPGLPLQHPVCYVGVGREIV